MMTRRGFAAGLGLAAAGAFSEAAFAQRAMVRGGELPADMVWLNANENPAGPPPAALQAMSDVLATTGRYHFQEFGDFYEALARSEGLEPRQIMAGFGSSEVLHAAVDAFTTAARPLIIMYPSFEGPMEVANGLGRPVVRVPLNAAYGADVRKMAEAAAKAGGGLIYICNPNNPTGTVTPAAEVDWLVRNLPANAVAVIDEAYIHFGSAQLRSGLDYVRQGRDVIVTRTFSKIYGMAGLRVGFGCARPELLARMAHFRNNPISVVAMRAVMAALKDAGTLVAQRREALNRTRESLCVWLRGRNVRYIESQANFMMIDIGRPVADFGPRMARLGVAPGRPFPPLDNMLRVTIGTDADMEKFREVFWKVYKG